MEIILLDKVRNLGNIGDKASVKAGYARNYLVPYGKAVVATKENLVKFEKMRGELEKKAAGSLKSAQDRAVELEGKAVTVSMKATEEGKLFGSVGISAIEQAIKEIGIKVEKSEVSMPQGPIRQVGECEVDLLLHTDVTVKLKVNVVAVKE